MSILLNTCLLLVLWMPHGDLHQQIADLDVQIRKAPGSVALRLRRAELLRLHQEYPRALRDLQKAAELDPDRREVHLFKGRLLFDMKRHRQALKAFDAFLRAFPTHRLGLQLAARCAHEAEFHDRACALYKRLLALPGTAEPDDVLSYVRSMERVEQIGAHGALVFLKGELAKRGTIITLELEALRLEKALGRYAEAINRLDRLALHQRRQDIWSVRRAEVYHLSGQRDLEERSWKNALSQLQRLPRAVRQRPATLALKKRIEDSLRAIK